MSNSTLILPDDLKGSSVEERNQLYISRYGFSLDEILELSEITDDFTKIIEISNAIIVHSQGIVDQGKIGAQLTQAVIGGLFKNPWDGNYNAAGRNVISVLKHAYKDETRNQSDLNLTSTHFLRQELGVYAGNLPLARKLGHELRASPYDLKESIMVPINIGFEEAMLTGIAYSRAILRTDFEDTDKENRGFNNGLDFRGTNYDLELPFYQMIADLVRLQYNYHTGVMVRNNKNEQDLVYPVPIVHVRSLAIASWYSDTLGFPKGEDHREAQVPDIFKESHLKTSGFRAGYFALDNKQRNIQF